MKLYYHPNSLNCVNVLATANQLGMQLDLQLVDLLKGAQKDPAYLALNPNGRVPTLADGDFILWESNAIMQYLAGKKPGNSLWPVDDRARADVSRWQFWQAFHWTRATGTLVWENMVKRFLNAGAPDPAFLPEEAAQQGDALFGTDVARHLEAVIEAGGAGLTEQPGRPDLRIARPVDQAADAGVHHRAETHQARLEGNVQGGAAQTRHERTRVFAAERAELSRENNELSREWRTTRLLRRG